MLGGSEIASAWTQGKSHCKACLILAFLAQVIEGDELYTKFGKNVPVKDCEGWTIVLMGGVPNLDVV